MKKKLYTAIGLMSGTSMDGVDISIIRSDGYDEFYDVLDKYYKYDKNLQHQLVNLRNSILDKNDLIKYSDELKNLERKITLFHVDKINQILREYKSEIDLIGFHGQTIFHNPQIKISKQLGDGKLLSQLLKKKVIYDFRQNDIKNNGQGAPLTPIFHYLLSKKIKKIFQTTLPMVFINIGGITNATKIIKSSEKIEDNLIAFDLGPGNCMIDAWVRNNSNNIYDKDGQTATFGKINQLILNQAIENFKIEKYTQSLDIRDFDVSFVKGLSLEDGCSTITNFTGYLIAKGIEYLNKKNDQITCFLCGGGRKNNYLIKCIEENLVNKNNIILNKIDKYNIDGDYIESKAFGYLAIRSYLKLPISFPKTTGCVSSVTGGKLVKNF